MAMTKCLTVSPLVKILYTDVLLESVQSPTLHTDLGIDRNELIRRLKQNIQSGQDGYPFV